MELIQNSQSLAERDKARLLNNLDYLDEKDLLVLEKTLLAEQEQANLIEKNFQKEVHQLDDEYRTVVQDFKHHKVPQVFAAVEKKIHASDEGDADQMIHSLFKP